MFAIKIDERKIEELFLEEIRKRLEQIEHRKTLWDMKELCKQTSMSENTIKDKFFYDERFQNIRQVESDIFQQQKQRVFAYVDKRTMKIFEEKKGL